VQTLALVQVLRSGSSEVAPGWPWVHLYSVCAGWLGLALAFPFRRELLDHFTTVAKSGPLSALVNSVAPGLAVLLVSSVVSLATVDYSAVLSQGLGRPIPMIATIVVGFFLARRKPM
jgi:hypothetical protein